MIRTSIVIVGYRSREHLERGLPAVLEDSCVGDVVVVDNSRDPGTASLVGRAEGRVRYVDPGSNLGFAKACNLGARMTGDPVVTFLNPDVLLTRSLAELAEACVGDDRSVRAGGLAGASRDLLGNARYAVTPRGELRRAVLGSRSSLVPVPAREGSIPVEQVDGALLMLSRRFFDRLGGYDERFELYFEDVDLCDRARAQGFVVLDTRRYGVHDSGASARTSSAAAYCAFRVSRIRYFTKRWRTAGALLALIITALEAGVRTLTRQPEGGAVRGRAVRMAVGEVRRPGSVRVLAQSGPT